MIKHFYLPVLKSKQGEFDALSKLSDKTKASIAPLLDITPMEWDHATKTKPRTIEVHLQNFCKKLLKKWPNSNTFIDTYLINDYMPNNMSCIEYIIKLLFEQGVSPVPVVRVDSPQSLLLGISTISLIYGLDDIGIRLTIADLTSPDIENDIEKILTQLDMSPETAHLIIDLQDADFTHIDDFADAIVQSFSNFSRFYSWKSVTVTGGSFPATNLIKVGVNLIPRSEWIFFKKVIEKLKVESFNREINFGDYSMVAPGYFEFDPTKMSRSANIRYTHDDIWYVIKGKALKKSEDYKQYVIQAGEIIKSSFYLGEDFSEGDLHLTKCSKGETTPGNPTVWSWVGNNHHFTKVVHDLFSSSHVASNI